MGYPNNANGEIVKRANYERVAWAVAGLNIFLPETPLGVGVLKGPFAALLKEKYPNSSESIPSTHSAWIELGLAFGYPGLLFMLGSVMTIILLSINSKSLLRSLTSLLPLGLFCLYTVGELSSQHSIEILFFLVALMTAMLFEQSNLKKISSNKTIPINRPYNSYNQ
jgi:hypothetical protein